MPTILALNPRKGKKKSKRRKMSAKQIKFFGTKAQKAALKRKRSAASKKGAAKKKPTKRGKLRKKLSAKQIKFFGTKAQKAALKRKRSQAAKKVTKKAAPKKRAIQKRKGSSMAKKNPKKGGKRKTGSNPVMNVTFGAMKSTVPLLFGALTAKFVAKKFAEGGAESDNWNWKNYLLAGLGTLVAALGTGAALRKRNVTQKVLEGGMLLIAYKIFTNEIAPMNTNLETWFGQADDDFDPYGALPARDGMGDIWQRGSSDYVRGVDGRWRPADERHRRPRPLPNRRGGGIPFGYRRGLRKGGGMGDVLVTPDSRYGDVLVTPDARYGDEPTPNLMAKAMEADGM